jgi:hypothetical protein
MRIRRPSSCHDQIVPFDQRVARKWCGFFTGPVHPDCVAGFGHGSQSSRQAKPPWVSTCADVPIAGLCKRQLGNRGETEKQNNHQVAANGSERVLPSQLAGPINIVVTREPQITSVFPIENREDNQNLCLGERQAGVSRASRIQQASRSPKKAAGRDCIRRFAPTKKRRGVRFFTLIARRAPFPSTAQQI